MSSANLEHGKVLNAARKGDVAGLWKLVNGGRLTADDQALAHEHIRRLFMSGKQTAIATKNCSLQGANGSSCIGVDIHASDFIRGQSEGVQPVDVPSQSKADRLNQRQLDRFNDTAGMLGDAARARPCEIDTPYSK